MSTFVDNWGEVQEVIDPKDWNKWALWANWVDEYEWVDDVEFETYDIIVWRDTVWGNVGKKQSDGKRKAVPVGERLIIAEVRKNTENWVYLIVIHSEGDKPQIPGEAIKRKRYNIGRFGLRRMRRPGEGRRLKIPDRIFDSAPINSHDNPLFDERYKEPEKKTIRSKFTQMAVPTDNKQNI